MRLSLEVMLKHFTNTRNKGFTLVELLVVMAILGILVTLVGAGLRTSQLRGRDGARKHDLRQITEALELHLSDFGTYPDSLNGSIVGCPTTTASVCVWGAENSTSEFTDGKTVYFKRLPKDPSSTQAYYYRIVDAPANQKYQLFARLENTKDSDCLQSNCTNPTVPTGVNCGGSNLCNFSITSPNTTPLE